MTRQENWGSVTVSGVPAAGQVPVAVDSASAMWGTIASIDRLMDITATSAGTTTLTVDSKRFQLLVGTATETLVLASAGVEETHSNIVVNRSTGIVTVKSSDATTIWPVNPGERAEFIALVDTPTGITHWLVLDTVTALGTQGLGNKTLDSSNTIDGAVINAFTDTFRLFDPANPADRVAGFDLSGLTEPSELAWPDASGMVALTADVSAAVTTAEARANHTGTQTSSTISDFAEAAQDALAAALAGTSGVSVSYNDAANTITVSGLGDSSATAETIRDAIGVALLGVGNISVTVNDGADTITISTTATVNDTDANLKARANHTGTQLAATILDFSTAADVRVSAGITTERTATRTLTNARVTKRLTTSNAPGAAPTYNTDDLDILALTGINAAITSLTSGRSGTAAEGDVMTQLFTDNGTARAITYGSLFSSGTAPLAPTTIPGSTIRQTYRYNATASKYECTESVVIGSARVKVQEFTNSSTSSTVAASAQPNPAGSIGVRVRIIPGGVGGGSGRRGGAGTARCGGGGGAGYAGMQEKYIPIPAGVTTYAYSLGPVGNGGAAVTANDTSGNPGGSSGTCSFNFTGSTQYPRIFGASMVHFGLGGGQASAGAGGNLGTSSGAVGSSGGSSSASGGVGGAGSASLGGDCPTGAGSGGGITTGDVANAGGAGGFNVAVNVGSQASGGVVDSTLPTAGAAADTTGAGLPGNGAGGGAASITTAAQAGANGVGYGAPGGGGGASLNGFNSGKGGDGGPGYLRLEWVYA